jgi:5'-methylthioadenosine phosphorylase
LFFGTIDSFTQTVPPGPAERGRAALGWGRDKTVSLRVRVARGLLSHSGASPALRVAVSTYGWRIRMADSTSAPLCLASSPVYFARQPVYREGFVAAVNDSAKVGVIGGSGFYELLDNAREVAIDTPFGPPSDSYFLGDIDGVPVAFLPRHARGHRILPGEVNYRANIWGMKALGVHSVLSASAVGSLREELKPLDVVVPDQLFDRTKARPSTFFGDGVVVHMGFADPFCPHVSRLLVEHGRAVGATVHEGGTYVCIEGPQFSTRAESKVYRQLGFDIIGMTNLQEAKLAREAELCYATMAMVTDYDVWYEGEEDVTLETVLENVRRNVETAQAIVRHVVKALDEERDCACRHAVESAINTPADLIPAATKEKLDLLIGKYLR